MSDRDLDLCHSSSSLRMNGHRFNPTANDFAPSDRGNVKQQHNNMSNQVSIPPSPYLEARVLNLEEKHATLRDDLNTVKELYHGLSSSVARLTQGGWSAHIGPFQEVDIAKSHQSAMHFKSELEKLSREVHQSVDGGADMQKVSVIGASKANGSMPPQMKAPSIASNGNVSKSIPPHMRATKKANTSALEGTQEPRAGVSPNRSLVTDNSVYPVLQEQKIPAAVPSPPASPTTVIESQLSTDVGQMSLDQDWKPHYLAKLPKLPVNVLSKIPAKNMVSFHPDFIHNTFDGVTWSPGLRFITGQGPCIVKNRTYYLLDPKTEPYLPKEPGEHGAKLTAFFNRAPEEEFGDLLDKESNSYENVPMFIMVDNRYVYFGNYSQTRWSDKLDHDTMTTKVSHEVKQYWATELSSTCREEWVTDELKKHFFKKPEYEGCLYAAVDDEGTTSSAQDLAFNQKMAKDIKKYIEELREWERDASVRASLIKDDSIMQAFDRADADDPPALRLWWEYLECVDWKKDFYDLLVTLQSRDPKQYLK